MRCHFGQRDDDENNDSSGLNIWDSTAVHNPSILKSVDNVNGPEDKSDSDDLSTLYSLDSVSQSYKRKILECEREDFEERFNKVQRKRQMLRATARANLVVQDDDDFDEENEIYEQMEWIEEESKGMTFRLWDENVHSSLRSISSTNPVMYIPKLNWREERRHLLRISMAKIRGVDDPEAYLRRSVLINNTVKRLQKDAAVSYKGYVTSSTYQEDCSNECTSWNLQICNDLIKNNPNWYNDFDYRSINNTDPVMNYNQEIHPVTPYNFHLSLITPFIPDNPHDSLHSEIVHNSTVFPKILQDDQSLCDSSLVCRTFKPTSSLHLFSSQPCGLQYRSTNDDTNNEFCESSSSSSLLDSVVYHSLIASLET